MYAYTSTKLYLFCFTALREGSYLKILTCQNRRVSLRWGCKWLAQPAIMCTARLPPTPTNTRTHAHTHTHTLISLINISCRCSKTTFSHFHWHICIVWAGHNQYPWQNRPDLWIFDNSASQLKYIHNIWTLYNNEYFIYIYIYI